MRVEMNDSMGFRHVIDSSDYELIGRWFTEKAALFMSADCRFNHPFQVDIWPSGPSSDADMEVMRQANRPVRSADGLLELVKGLLHLSVVWQAAESEEAAHAG
jgi:hypothetical protein